MYFNRFFCALIFFSAISVGTSLKCYHCNVTLMYSTNNDPCRTVAYLQKCQDPAVCLTAKYSYKDFSSPETVKIVKSCFPNMAGTECTNFMKNQNNINRESPNMALSESCATCTDDGCNHIPEETVVQPEKNSLSTASGISAFSLLALVSIVLKMLL